MPASASPGSPLLTAPLTAGNVHVYSNGRMRYNYQQRQDRRENQGDVSAEGAGSGGEGAWRGSDRLSVYSGWDGSGPTASAEEPSWASLAIPRSDTGGSHTPRCPEEWGFDGLVWRMSGRMLSTYRWFGCEQPLCSPFVRKANTFQAMEN